MTDEAPSIFVPDEGTFGLEDDLLQTWLRKAPAESYPINVGRADWDQLFLGLMGICNAIVSLRNACAAASISDQERIIDNINDATRLMNSTVPQIGGFINAAFRSIGASDGAISRAD